MDINAAIDGQCEPERYPHPKVTEQTADTGPAKGTESSLFSCVLLCDCGNVALGCGEPGAPRTA